MFPFFLPLSSKPVPPARCRHCGGTDPLPSGLNGWDICFIACSMVTIVFVFFFSLLTLLDWMNSNETLWGITKDHAMWIWQLFHRIW